MQRFPITDVEIHKPFSNPWTCIYNRPYLRPFGEFSHTSHLRLVEYGSCEATYSQARTNYWVCPFIANDCSPIPPSTACPSPLASSNDIPKCRGDHIPNDGCWMNWNRNEMLHGLWLHKPHILKSFSTPLRLGFPGLLGDMPSCEKAGVSYWHNNHRGAHSFQKSPIESYERIG